jgi:zinc transport system substrate-binding protein
MLLASIGSRTKKLNILWVCILLCSSYVLGNERSIVVTIKPIHSLVSALMISVPNVRISLLCQGSWSPHGEQLKPSQIRLLQTADWVISVGPSYEGMIATLQSKIQAPVICVEHAPNLYKLPQRSARCCHEETGNMSQIDGHLWLSLPNAIAIVQFLSEYLQKNGSPEWRDLISMNARTLIQRIQSLQDQWKKKLKSIHGMTYGVDHDWLQYWDHDWGTRCMYWLAPHMEHAISARALQQLQKTPCKRPAFILVEPHFPEHVRIKLITQLQIPFHTLDYLGRSIPAGPDAYFEILESIAACFLTAL